MKMISRVLAITMAVLAAGATSNGMAGVVAAGEYRLGARDKIRLKVVEWRAGKGEYFEWQALTGEYVVDPAGAIPLPLLGQLPAGGRTTAEFAKSISEELQRRAGLANQPDVSVQVVEFRPIYLVGEVERPGEYSYRPGLNVIQAVSIGGGMYRPGDLGNLRLERDHITASGMYEGTRLELRRMMVRHARLKSELNGSQSIDRTRELELMADENIERFFGEEGAILLARTSAVKSQLDSLDELKGLLRSQIVSLKKKVNIQSKQIELAATDRAVLKKLQKKGLVTASRMMTADRTLADAESKLVDLETSILKVKQDLSDTDRRGLNLVADREGSLTQELQTVDGRIDELTAKLRTAHNLMQEASMSSAASGQSNAVKSVGLNAQQEPARKIRYSVLRPNGDGTSREIIADESTPLEPGDVVRVAVMSTAANANSQAVSLQYAGRRRDDSSIISINASSDAQ